MDSGEGIVQKDLIQSSTQQRGPLLHFIHIDAKSWSFALIFFIFPATKIRRMGSALSSLANGTDSAPAGEGRWKCASPCQGWLLYPWRDSLPPSPRDSIWHNSFIFCQSLHRSPADESCNRDLLAACGSLPGTGLLSGLCTAGALWPSLKAMDCQLRVWGEYDSVPLSSPYQHLKTVKDQILCLCKPESVKIYQLGTFTFFPLSYNREKFCFSTRPKGWS